MLTNITSHQVNSPKTTTVSEHNTVESIPYVSRAINHMTWIQMLNNGTVKYTENNIDEWDGPRGIKVEMTRILKWKRHSTNHIYVSV